MTRKKKVPEIRFKGFCEEWEEKKLGELANITTGKLDANAMREDGQYDFYTSGIKKYKIDVAAFEGPAITIAGNGATVGYMHLADGKFNAYQRTYILSQIQANRTFLFAEIGNVLPIKISQEARTGNIPYIVLDMLTDLLVFLPEDKEQSPIGTFFQNLDTLIDLHQRKYNKLTTVKKSMFEKMFPKDGADVPEIRFKGFIGKWSNQKLNEIALFSKGWGYNKDDLTTTGTPIIHYGRLYTKYETVISEVDTFATPKDKSLYSSGIEVIVPASGETAEDIARASAVIQSHVLLGGDLNVIYPNNNINSVFLALTISNGSPQREISKRAQGKSIVHLHNSDLQDVSVFYPSINEQIKIAAFFQNLDTLISLQQQELDKLKNIQKACLKKMFI